MRQPHVDRARQLLQAEIDGRNSPAETRELLAADGPARIAAATELLLNILDQVADYEYSRRENYLDACDAAMLRLGDVPDPTEPPLLGLVGLICLNVKLLERRFESPNRKEQENADQYCRDLFESAAIWAAIREIYRPTTPPADTDPASIDMVEYASWHALDFQTLQYYKAGTTSFILRAKSLQPIDESGTRRELVLKCVLFPWNKLAAVAQATDHYATQYGGTRTPGVVVHPIASTDRWVIMPYQEGETLTDHLEHFENSDAEPSLGVRVVKAREVGLSLVRALHELAGRQPVDSTKRECQHLDLSPSNIIITPQSHVMFIDLGPNHLYSRQIGIAEHDDAVYIAPEVKNRGNSPTADVYSLAIILMQILVGSVPRDGRVPDGVYEMSPTIGRFLDDLIDEDPHRRLLLFEEGQPFSFDTLEEAFKVTFDLASQEPETSTSTRSRLLARALPTSREVQTQYKQLRVARRSRAGKKQASYLLIFSLIATICWWFIFAKTALFKIDDIATLSLDELPSGDLRAAVIIAFSQGLIGAKFYQTVLARLSSRRIPGALALATEISMRAMCVVALPTVLVSVFWKPSLWAWGCAAGAVAVSLTNLLVLTLTLRIYQAGAKSGISTAPRVDLGLSRGFEQWWWTMLLYSVVIFVIATGLQFGFMSDRGAYVFGLVLISFGIHYISKFVIAGYGVRGGLSRAFAIGERLSILQERGDTSVQNWPPRIRAQHDASARPRSN